MGFNVSYAAGGTIDKVKKIQELETVAEVEVVESVSKVEAVKNIENLESVDKVDQVENVTNVETLETVKVIEELKTIGSIKGFASKTQPYNYMRMIGIPALRGTIEEEIVLPPCEVEILGISVTCSGYGENDHYDLMFNEQQWFNNWYLGEVKDGLFLGSSTYVYAAPASSRVVLKFHNDSGTSKKVWFGIRMLVDPNTV